jgi:hypothetical protein
MPRTKLEEQLDIQMSQIGIVQRFLTNLKKLGKSNIMRNCLTSHLELLESYLLQVVYTHHGYNGIADPIHYDKVKD